MRRIGNIARALLESLPGDTPAAVVQWAGGIDERRLLTRLDRLAADAADAGFDSPAVILVGSAIGESVERRWGEHGDPREATAVWQADDAVERESIAYAA
jgi:uroporphyrin-III C-methyltransferase